VRQKGGYAGCVLGALIFAKTQSMLRPMLRKLVSRFSPFHFIMEILKHSGEVKLKIHLSQAGRGAIGGKNAISGPRASRVLRVTSNFSDLSKILNI